MSLYAVFLFIHVAGVLGYATGTLMSLFGLPALRRTRWVEQACWILELLERVGPLSGISLLFIIASGLYMAGTSWGWRTGWIDVALGTLILLLVAGALMGTRRHAIAVLIQDMPDGPLPRSVIQRLYDPWMGLGTYELVTLLLGVVFLMTVKPALTGSLLVIAVALVLGLGISLLNWNKAGQVSEEVRPTA